MNGSKLPYKRIETNFMMNKYCKAALENNTSAFAREGRVNVSIQAEGTIHPAQGQLAVPERFLSFGKKRAFTEKLIMSMVIDVIHLANMMERSGELAILAFPAKGGDPTTLPSGTGHNKLCTIASLGLGSHALSKGGSSFEHPLVKENAAPFVIGHCIH